MYLSLTPFASSCTTNNSAAVIVEGPCKYRSTQKSQPLCKMVRANQARVGKVVVPPHDSCILRTVHDR